MSDAAAPKPVDRKAVYTLMLINFIDLMGFGLVILLLPFYAIRFEASDFAIGALLATFSLGQFIGAPMLGAWSDRIGRRPVLMVSQWGGVIGYLILAASTWFQWSSPSTGLAILFLARAVAGFTAGNLTVTNAYIADVIPPKERAGVIGLLGAAFGLGFAFGPPIGGFLGGINHALPGLLAAALSTIASIMVWKFLPESHTNRQATNAGRFAFSSERLRVVMQQPAVLWLTVIWFLSMLAYVMLEPTIPLILHDYFNYGEREAGYFFGIVGLVIIFVQGGLVRPLNKRFGEWPLAMAGAALGMIGLLLYAQVPATPLLVLLGAAGILNACGRSLQTPTLSALLSQNAPPEHQGASYGVYQGTASLARVFGPLAGGLLYARHPVSMFFVGAGLMAVAAVILILIRPMLRSSRSEDIPVEPEVAAGES